MANGPQQEPQDDKECEQPKAHQVRVGHDPRGVASPHMSSVTWSTQGP